MVLNDNDIIALISAPDTRERGFRRLLALYGDKIYWHIRRIVVGHDDAEDVMQEVAIKIFKNLDTFKGDSTLLTWIYRIATNEALRWVQRQTPWWKNADNVTGLDLADTLSAETSLDGSAAEVLFQKALLTLPTQQRIAFNMRYYDELSYEEIAKITGKNINTLKTNYHFAAEKIKEYLKENAI